MLLDEGLTYPESALRPPCTNNRMTACIYPQGVALSGLVELSGCNSDPALLQTAVESSVLDNPTDVSPEPAGNGSMFMTFGDSAHPSSGWNRRLLFVLLAGSCGGLLFGYDIGAIASAEPEIRKCFALSPAGLGLAVSAVLFGTVAGSVIGGLVADMLGRRVALFLSALLYALAAMAAATAGGPALFASARFLCGLAIGLISVIVPVYLAEVAPPHLRGRMVGAFQLNVSIGVVAAFLAGYLFSFHGHSAANWRLLLSCGAAPALLCIVCLFFSASTPGWMTQQHSRAPTTACMTFAAPEAQNAKDAARLFSRRNLRPIALAVSIAMFNQLTGVNALLYYVLDVFRELGSGRLNGRADALTLAVIGLLVTLAAVMVIDHIGRKPLLLAGAVGMGICLFLLPAARHHYWPGSAVVLLFACYDACFGFSQGAVIWVYLSEIFPAPLRAKGQSLGGTVHWVANAFVVLVFPEITSRFGGKVFVGLALLMVLQFLVVLLFYPETKEKIPEPAALRGAGKLRTNRSSRSPEAKALIITIRTTR